MGTLTIERASGSRIEANFPYTLCDRLDKFFEEQFRAKNEAAFKAWDALIEMIFDTYLKEKGY